MKLINCFINGYSTEALNESSVNSLFTSLFDDTKSGLYSNLSKLSYHFHFADKHIGHLFCKMDIDEGALSDGASSPTILKPIFPTWSRRHMAYSVGAFAHDMIYAVAGRSDDALKVIDRQSTDSMLQYFWTNSHEWHPIIKAGPALLASAASFCIEEFAGSHWGDDNHHIAGKVHISYWTRIGVGITPAVVQ